MINEDEKYLLLGASRGGTTLLAGAQAVHSDVAMLDQAMSAAFNSILVGRIPSVKLRVPNHTELD